MSGSLDQGRLFEFGPCEALHHLQSDLDGGGLTERGGRDADKQGQRISESY